MLVIMQQDSTVEQCAKVEDVIRDMGYEPLPVPGESRTAICVTGNKGPVDPSFLQRLAGVRECVPVTRPYKLVSREVNPESTVVDVAGVEIGGSDPVVIAGPCSVETPERTLAVAEAVKLAGGQLFRAGAFKPRTSPYSFQGFGYEALDTLAEVRERVGLPVVSEVVDTEAVGPMSEVVDMLQIGSRNMQNFALIKKLSMVRVPILLKRGLSASLEEWMLVAEYLLSAGNHQVILCERGIRGLAGHARNIFDLNVVPLVRSISHLPIIADPSHGVGDRSRVRAMARAAIACGAQGLLIEAHTTPDSAFTDAAQTIDMKSLSGICRDIRSLRSLETLPLDQ
ncbi:3-deoxy-7-phosphoheptulonate synthase [Gemmatimonadales bacterium]|nr:3-deoxy-7-phosphoheptulonate synthase [Gemmatimonadales bacterium]